MSSNKPNSGVCTATLDERLRQLSIRQQDDFHAKAVQQVFQDALLEKNSSQAVIVIQGYAKTLRGRGAPAEIEQLYLDTIRNLRAAFGRHHLSTLSITLDLGILLSRQHRMQEAEQMYRHALDGIEEGNPYSLYFSNELGVVYAWQGKLSQAEKQFTAALRGLVAYNECHAVDKAWSCTAAINLADVYERQDRIEDANAVLRQVGITLVSGMSYKSAISKISFLSRIYASLMRDDQFAAAQRPCRIALAAFERVLGPDHRSTLRVVLDLAAILTREDHLIESKYLIKRALAGIQKRRHLGVLGQPSNDEESWEPMEMANLRALDDKLALIAAYTLANSFRAQGKHRHAESLCNLACNALHHYMGTKQVRKIHRIGRRNTL